MADPTRAGETACPTEHPPKQPGIDRSVDAARMSACATNSQGSVA